MAELGNRIRKIRGTLTQKELAEKLGVDNTTIASWEAGRREPDVDSLIKIAKLAGVSLDWLTARNSWDLETEKEFNQPEWHELISLSVKHAITPDLLMPVVQSFAGIKQRMEKQASRGNLDNR
ncbi:MAG: helix-turn-helix transcriptional regulator [Sporomusaceae bacterium]|nr:helix-turn-helix transcriptional regulator [Sporomusaceae bacterium]